MSLHGRQFLPLCHRAMRPLRSVARPVLLCLLSASALAVACTDRSATAPHNAAGQAQASLAEVRAIAKEAYIYGFPMVDSYRIQYSYFVDSSNPEYKGEWNKVHSVARVFTPQDKAIQTPNSDTPYSFLGADLRAEPLVLSVPAVPQERYYSLQFIDMYTHNFAYVGSRATGSDAGHYLLAGPGWAGEKPEGIDDVIRSETEFAFVLYRTQLFGPGDVDEVKKIQSGYTVQLLSEFAGTSKPQPAPDINFVKPLAAEAQRTSLQFFDILNFVLQFAPTHPSETELLARFSRVGIEPGTPFDSSTLSADKRQAMEQGMADAWQAFSEFKAAEIDTGRKSSADGFGTREFLGDDYVVRMASAALGIYGNSKEEAIYPAFFVDADGRPLDGSVNRYTLKFAPGQLPPVNSFWSLTMYELPAKLLTENELDRYLINSAMAPDLLRDEDGAITLYVQHESPGQDKEANWLPAPDGPFFMILREYWPKPEALDGTWKVPSAVRVDAK